MKELESLGCFFAEMVSHNIRNFTFGVCNENISQTDVSFGAWKPCCDTNQ